MIVSTMGSIVIIPILTLMLTIMVGGQSTICSNDKDCSKNQYCYEASNLCVNYTRCKNYNRLESSTFARQPSQCGSCILGYTKEILSNGEADMCTKDLNCESGFCMNNVVILSTAIGSIIVIGLIVYSICCWNKKHRSTERSNFDASAPPPPENHISNKYRDIEESIPLQMISRKHDSCVIEDTLPVKSQGYHPPNWVNLDVNYNEEAEQPDSVQNVTLPPRQIIFEIAMNRQPFDDQQNDSTTNNDIISPIVSSNQGYREDRQNNGPSTSTEFGNGDRNRRGNSQPTVISNQIEINILNQNNSYDENLS